MGTFTSVLDEASIVGKRVISVQYASRVNTSPLMDMKFPWVEFVKNVEQAKHLLEKNFIYRHNSLNLSKALKHFYYSSDLKIKKIWKDQIYKINRKKANV